jgi:hypothetical protein
MALGFDEAKSSLVLIETPAVVAGGVGPISTVIATTYDQTSIV